MTASLRSWLVQLITQLHGICRMSHAIDHRESFTVLYVTSNLLWIIMRANIPTTITYCMLYNVCYIHIVNYTVRPAKIIMTILSSTHCVLLRAKRVRMKVDGLASCRFDCSFSLGLTVHSHLVPSKQGNWDLFEQ